MLSAHFAFAVGHGNVDGLFTEAMTAIAILLDMLSELYEKAHKWGPLVAAEAFQTN